MIQHPPPGGRKGFTNRWTYAVATSLLEPKSDEEWNFLRKCAENHFEDGWADYGAIQTLKLIASDRSRRILEEAATKNEFRAKQIAKALEYVRSSPPPLEGRDLVELAKRVALAARIGHWVRNGPPFYDQAGDKALVDIEFETAEDYLTYTATFHAANGRWKLRGVRETLQGMKLPPAPKSLPPPPQLLPPPPKIDSSPPLPTAPLMFMQGDVFVSLPPPARR